MLDIKFIRENPKKVKEGCQKKQVKVNIDRLLEVDRKRREVLRALENMKAQKNKATIEISGTKKENEKRKIIMKMKELDKKSDRLTKTTKELDKEFNKLILQIPNLPQEDVPVGKDERDNKILKEVGEIPEFDFEPRDYMEIAERLDLIDVKRAAKISGSRFGFLRNEAVLIEVSLINLALDSLTEEGFVPIIPSVMLKSEVTRGMGYLEQADKEDAYYLPKDDLYLVGTSEQSMGAMHADEIFQEKELPKRYVGFSTCFRREAGAYGRDTRGILRVHQFDKVEMFSFCHPNKSRDEHHFLLSMEEKLMRLLGIPYRVVQMCTTDIAFPQAAKFDIEAWMPGQGKYRETHSTSTCTDFQARRLNIRYKKKDGGLDFVHTLNGTAFAIGRMLITIIENYQQKDGTVKIPDVLQKYTKFKQISRGSAS
ncbi:hypothetical protein AMJ48_01850 [Parcubacteria bacterium DG_74_1]|nr:MAG: hypothetical protein AMJ48_01850 [Parcubacteria bacterium DG_74_1]